MNVLHVNEQTGWRGGEQQAGYLIQGLVRRGHRVVIAGRRDERLCPNGTCDPCLYPACASQITVEKVRTAVSAALAEAQAGVSGPGPQSPAHVGGTQQ